MKSDVSGVFNVGSGSPASFNDVVIELNRVLKTDLQQDYFENPYNFFQVWTEADVSAGRRALNYQPQFNLRRGIEAYQASGCLGM